MAVLSHSHLVSSISFVPGTLMLFVFQIMLCPHNFWLQESCFGGFLATVFQHGGWAISELHSFPDLMIMCDCSGLIVQDRDPVLQLATRVFWLALWKILSYHCSMGAIVFPTVCWISGILEINIEIHYLSFQFLYHSSRLCVWLIVYCSKILVITTLMK